MDKQSTTQTGTDTETPSKEQAIEAIEADDADEIRDALPADIRSALTKRAFSPGAMRKLLRDTYYLGPISIGTGGWIGMYGNGQPGTGMRRPDGALYHFPRSWRYAALDRGLRLGLIAHTGDSRFATTERGVAVLHRVDICSECGQTRVPKIAKSWYKRSPTSGAETSSRLVTKCPDCGGDGYGDRSSNSGTSYTDWERSEAALEFARSLIEDADVEDVCIYGVENDVDDAVADVEPEVDLEEIEAILDEHVEAYVPGTPRETHQSLTEDHNGRPVVVIGGEGDAIRYSGTEASISVTRVSADRGADVRIVADPEDDERVRVEMSYDVAVKQDAKARLDVFYNVVKRSWDSAAKQWTFKANGLSAVLGTLTMPEWANNEDNRAFEVVVTADAVARAEYPVLGVDADGDLIDNSHLQERDDDPDPEGGDVTDADDDAAESDETEEGSSEGDDHVDADASESSQDARGEMGAETEGEDTQTKNDAQRAQEDPVPITDGGEVAPGYETKTVRVHLPDRGMYIYIVLTRFDGTDHLLGEMGYRGEYTLFTILSGNKVARVADTDPFALARKYPGEWLRDTAAFEFMYHIDTGKIPWDAIADGDRFTPEAIEALTDPELATDGGVDPEDDPEDEPRFETLTGERRTYTESEILDDLVQRGIARPVPRFKHEGDPCKRPGCDKPVPANSSKSLNLGISSGYCGLLCLLEHEDSERDAV